MTDTCTYKQDPIYIHHLYAKNPDMPCAVCGKPMKNCPAVFICCNHKHFPNIMLHETCLDERSTEELFPEIEAKYRQYLELQKIFG